MYRPALNYQERERIINSINTGDDRDSIIIDLYDRLHYNIQRINDLDKRVSTARVFALMSLILSAITVLTLLITQM